jgi:hypothetical protein
MTSTDAAAAMTGTRAGHDRLGALLLIDAAMCAACGAVAIAAAGPVVDLLGVESQAWVRGIGVFLVVYSLALWSLTRVNRSIAVRGAAATAVGDGVWVAATVALVIAGVFSGVGIAVMIATGLVVGALGTAKVDAIRSARVS